MLRDIKNVIINPCEAFERIKEKGSILPSFFIFFICLIIYSAFVIIFSSSSFPPLRELEKIAILDSIVIPLLIAPVFRFFLWTGIIHFVSSRYSLEGSYRQLLSIWGYTYIPLLLSSLAFPLFYLEIYIDISKILASFIFWAIFIWEIALIIITIKIIYKFTLKKVLTVLCMFFIVASIFKSIFVSFNETFFFQSCSGYITFIRDKISYYFRCPKEGELVVFVNEEDVKKKSFFIHLSTIVHETSICSWKIGGPSEEYIGRIKKKRENDFLVLPGFCKKEVTEESYRLLKRVQVKERIVLILKEKRE